MDWVTQDLRQAARLELDQLAQPRRRVLRIPPDRLLCEMVADHRALAIWENEGGSLGR